MQEFNKRAPFVFLIAWIILIGSLLWLKLSLAQEPPAWDSLSYFQKAFLFWQSVSEGRFFNPFDIEPTVRPPGTILLTYPFGFDPDFRGFYFRASFTPLCLFIVAVLVAGSDLAQTAGEKWRLALLALILSSTTTLFQFQPNDDVPWEVTWGMVDSFLAALAALSAACIIRSARHRSYIWLLAGAGLAALCFWVKPSGLLVMALIGACWVVLFVYDARMKLRPSLVGSITGVTLGLAVYVPAILLGFTSDYFSAQNVAFGNQVVSILTTDVTASVTPAQFVQLISVGFGFPLVTVTLLGLALCCRQRSLLAHLGSALIVLAVGVWFWWFQTEPWEPRYALPFVAMAFVLTLPALVPASSGQIGAMARHALPLLALPSVLIAAALALPQPSRGLEKLLGINLAVDAFRAEREQADQFRLSLSSNERSLTAIYAFDISAGYRPFQAIIAYHQMLNPQTNLVQFRGPVDWQRPSAFRIDEILRSNYILFEPINDKVSQGNWLALTQVPDFYTEGGVFRAWASQLTPNDGVSVISESKLRLLRIDQPALLEAAFQKLQQDRTWPDAFQVANAQSRLSLEDWNALSARGSMLASNIEFNLPGSAETTVHVRGIRKFADTPLQIDAWVEGISGTENIEHTLFCHALDRAGDIIANVEARIPLMAELNAQRPIQRVGLIYNVPADMVQNLACGVFKRSQPNLQMLQTQDQPSDWDGKRRLIPLRDETP